MSTTSSKSIFTVSNMTRMGLLTAAACLLDLIPGIPLFGSIYKLDFSMLPVLLGSFAMGPIEGGIILLLKCLIGWAHSTSMGIGKLAEFLMGLMLVLPAALIYHRNKTRKTAIIGMAVGTLCMVFGSILVNKWILFPFYMTAFHMDMEKILKMITVPGIDSELKMLLLITGPFNLIKGVVLSLLTALIYKPLSPLLHGRTR
jgi:riboflavin transporter FmnP